jgi:WD40 repeat protein
MKLFTTLSLSCLLLCITAPTAAQLTFNIVNTDGSRYPDIGVRFLAQGTGGREIRDYSPSDFTVIENGIPRPVISVSCPPPMTPVLSLTLTMDLSFSMTVSNRLENMKMAATQLVNDLSYPPASTGITTFADLPTVRLDYTQDRAAILASISSMSASGGGTDFIEAFMHPTAGAIAFTTNRPQPRYIVFITDAVQVLTAAQETQIITAARAANIRIFTVSLSANTINMSLRRIATQTNGAWFEDVVSETQAKNIFRQIGEQIFEYLPCELIYRTDGCDTERSIAVTLRKNNRTVTRNTTVSVPANRIISIDASTVLLDYGTIPGGSTRELTVRLTARNGTVNFQSITSPETAFRILDYGGSAPPFTLAAGQSRTLRIQYRPVNTDRVFGRLVINADSPCHETIVMTGGVYDPSPLELLTPNGGEKLFSGSFFRCTWRGISGTTPAELEYSTNSGTSWLRISDNVYNYAYNWRVPNTPSDECLGLVYTKEERITALDEGWGMLQPASINALAIARSGTLTALGLGNGQIKLFYPRDGAFITLLAGHSGGTRALSFSPDMRLLASAGADGTVKIWDMQTSTLARTLTGFSGNVHSVAFSDDGSLLVASDATTVILWQTSNWGERWRHTGDSGADGAIAIAADNSFIASGAGNRIAILNITNGNRLRNLTGHTGAVRSIDIAHDVSVIASASDDRTVRIWNARTWASDLTLSGHTGPVRSVQLTNSGIRVISASADNSVRIWDGRYGTLLHTFSGHTGTVYAAAVDHRIKYIISGGEDMRLRLWGYVPPLADKSEDLWEIIMTVSSLDHDMPAFTVLQCPDDYSEVELLLNNIGNQDVTISSMYISGQDSSVFSIEGGFTIPPPIMLKPEDSLKVRVRFAPNTIGSFNSELIFETDIPGNPIYAVTLSGHKDTVSLTLSEDTLYAGEMYQCTDPVFLPLVLTNDGEVTIAVDSIDSSLGEVLSFAGFMPRTMTPGQSDTIFVRVAPVEDGTIDGLLRMRVSPCSFEREVRIIGARLTAQPIAHPNPVDFGFAPLGETRTATLTLVNPTAVEMFIDSMAVLYPTPPFRMLSGPDTAFTLGPNDSVQFVFEYAPVEEGDAGGQMFFHANAPCLDSLLVDFVASSSRKPAIAFSKTEFTELICLEDSVSLASVTLRNTGGLPLDITAMRFEGPDAIDFRVMAPLPPLTLNPGDSETFQLAFNTQTLRVARNSELIVESNAENIPRLVIPFAAYKHEVSMQVLGADRDFGELYYCNFPVYDSVLVRNTGTYALDFLVDSSLLRDGYIIEPPLFTFSLPPGDEQRFVLTFNPSTQGVRSETFRVSASPCLDAVAFTYSYHFANHIAEVQPPDLDFGTLGTGATATRSFTVRNPWSNPMSVTFTGSAFADLRSWSPDPLPTRIEAGATITITLEFGGEDLQTLLGDLRIHTSIGGCEDSSNVITLRGRVEGSVATVELPELTAEIGQLITIPIRLRNSSNLALTGTKSFRVSLLFNRSMLWPEAVSSTTGVASLTTEAAGGNLRSIIEVTQDASPVDGIIAELTCLVMLGNDDATSLVIETFEWLEGTTRTQLLSGRFVATGICEEGGKRLLAPPGVPSLQRNAPNPFSSTTELQWYLPEDASIELCVYNSLGRRVAVLASGYHTTGHHRAVFDASGLPSGVYVAVLRTPDGMQSVLMLRR